MRIKKLLSRFKAGIQLLFLNYFICNIPSWYIRRFLYKTLGMKIGKGSRINMKCTVLNPKGITIGDRTIINEYCYLDGRGGLTIGDDSSISVYSMLITGSHSKSSPTFAYRPGEVVIGSNVWLGSRAIVLDNSTIEDKAIISAGSVFKGTAESNYVYVGNPATKMKCRNLDVSYKQDYHPFFK